MQRTDGQPKRKKLLQNRRKMASIRAEYAEIRRARARRKEQRLGNDPDVQLYRMEKELAMLRWEIKAITMDHEQNAESAA